MQLVENNPLKFYQFDMWRDVTHGVFTRHGGVSAVPWASLNLGGNVGDDAAAVRQNHELMYETLNVNRRRACTVWQVHGRNVVMVDRPVEGRRWVARADSMVTDRPDTPLVMRYADCVPLLFHDPRQGVIAIAHAGWRGTVAGVGSNTVRTMVEAYGCRPADIQVGIGPSIGPSRYQVGEEVVAAVQAWFNTTDGLINRDPADGTAYLNLWAANVMDVQRAGVECVEVAGICTASQTEDFFSHRAEAGKTGRFGAVMAL